jgi:glyoxylase-like metal-dependent hydrolase (beta-lactamase superfamily II)
MSADISYTQLNIGCLSRNKFWGEPRETAFRAAECTSTLIELPDASFLLVDPGLPYERMKELIYNRRGVSIDKVSAIFLTHFHGDHWKDLHRYEKCRVFAAKEEIALNDVSSLPEKVEALPENQFPGIKPVLLPGHTLGITGLALESGGYKVLIAGDIVMTKDFFLAGEGFFNTADENALKESYTYIKEHFDIIVPGHDVQFFIGE